MLKSLTWLCDQCSLFVDELNDFMSFSGFAIYLMKVYWRKKPHNAGCLTCIFMQFFKIIISNVGSYTS